MIAAIFGLITLVLVSLFIIGVVGYSVYFVAYFAFHTDSTTAAIICLVFGMGGIIYSLLATVGIIEKTEKWW